MSSLYQRSDSNFFWISYIDERGVRVQKSLKTKNKEEAKYKQRFIDNQISKGDTPEFHKRFSIGALYSEFIANRKIDHPPATIRYYNQTLTPFLDFVGHSTPLKSITDRKIDEYFLKRKNRWHTIKCIHTLFNFAVDRKYLSVNHLTVKKPKIQDRIPEALTDEEVKSALKTTAGTVAYRIIYANLFFGMRPSEMWRLKWSDIDFDNRIMTIQESKVGKYRQIIIHPDAIKFLKKIPRTGEYVFEQLSKNKIKTIGRDLKKNAGLDRISRIWYSLRHTFGTNYYEQTGDMKGLQEILGHSKLETTKKYVHPHKEHFDRMLSKYHVKTK